MFMHMHHPGFALLGFGLFAALFAFFLHFVPSFIAFTRNHPMRWAILAVNIIFGWTIVGWVLTLVWALMAPPLARYPPNPPYPPYSPPGGRPM
jgi:hypothetical protein